MPITLLTDFGTADYFVAAMKGVLLARAPGVPIVDITHEIPPQDVHAAAFTLLAVHAEFPAGTIHVAVVDPGVGSARRAILVEAAGQLFIGPDNGIFSYVCERAGAARAVHLTRERFFRHPVSTTFHGRDVFAAVAGALAAGAGVAELGEPIDDWVRLETLAARRTRTGEPEGAVIHIDRFGNCVTNLTPAELPPARWAAGVRLEVGGREIRSLRPYYAGAAPGEVFAIWGSAGFLELSANRDSAARLLGVGRGAVVRVRTG